MGAVNLEKKCEGGVECGVENACEIDEEGEVEVKDEHEQ